MIVSSLRGSVRSCTARTGCHPCLYYDHPFGVSPPTTRGITNYGTSVRFDQLMGRISPHDAHDLSPRRGDNITGRGVNPCTGTWCGGGTPKGWHGTTRHTVKQKTPASGHKKRGQPERIDPEDGGDLLSHYTQYHRRRRA